MGQKRLSAEQRRSIKTARKFTKSYPEDTKLYRATKKSFEPVSVKK